METLSSLDRLAHWAQVCPEKVAVRLIDGDVVTALNYRELDDRASQVAQWLIGLGLQQGDGIALLMENHPDLFALAWGARRAGLYYTPVSVHLNPAEVGFILRDCGAKLLVATLKTLTLANANALEGWAGARYLLNGEAPGFLPFASAVAAYTPGSALPERSVGRDFLYSSGTTGRPKGIKRSLIPFSDRFRDAYDAVVWREFFHFGADCIYLTMAPLYHAAPLRSSMRNIEWGGSNIIASRFDAELALRLIAQYRATHSQWVPTMMIRMLALPDAIRAQADLTSIRVAIHAAAPCPPEVKRRMSTGGVRSGTSITGAPRASASPQSTARNGYKNPVRSAAHSWVSSTSRTAMDASCRMPSKDASGFLERRALPTITTLPRQRKPMTKWAAQRSATSAMLMHRVTSFSRADGPISFFRAV